MGILGDRIKIGCSVYLLLFACLSMLAIWGIFFLAKNLLCVSPIRVPATSHLAAKRGREKTRVFQEINSLKRIILTELEINSIAWEELQISDKPYFGTIAINLYKDEFILDGIIVLARIFFPIGGKANPASWFGELKTRIKISGNIIMLSPNEAKICPNEVIIGQREIPLVAIEWIRSFYPDFWIYSLPVNLDQINFRSREMELIKPNASEESAVINR